MQGYNLIRDREKRQIKPLVRYGYADLITYASLVVDEVKFEKLASVSEALRSPKAAEWKKVMLDELESLKKNNT